MDAFLGNTSNSLLSCAKSWESKNHISKPVLDLYKSELSLVTNSRVFFYPLKQLNASINTMWCSRRRRILYLIRKFQPQTISTLTVKTKAKKINKIKYLWICYLKFIRLCQWPLWNKSCSDVDWKTILRGRRHYTTATKK